MKHARAAAVIVLALALTAQAPRPRVAAGLDAIKAADLRADLTFLTSDPMEGRLSLERGSEVAVQWIAAEFARAGLKPAAGNSFLQVVPLVEYRTDREATSLVIHGRGLDRTLKDADLLGSFPNDGTYGGKVVFAGYGITAPELKYDDYAGLDAKGKVVLVFNHEPQEDDAQSIFNGKGNTRYANVRAKMTIAQQHGAVALLIAPDPNHPKGHDRGPLGLVAGAPPRTPRPTQAIADEASIPAFTISAGAADALFKAAGKDAAGVQTAIDRSLAPQPFAVADVDATLHVANALRRRANSWNVVGLVEGSDPQLAAETIVMSGHFDHDGMENPMAIYRGADDNGSGTVGVVELARAFGRNPVKPRRSVLLIVFAAEERGLLGSYYYVAHPLRPLATTRAVINFDMIGRDEADSSQTHGLIDIAADTTNELNIIGTKYSPDYRKVVEQANGAVGLRLSYKWDEDTVLNILFRSDQYPFLMYDIPAMWWFTGFHPDYHQITDTVDRIDFAKMEKILKLSYTTAFEFADSATPPTFLATGAPK